MAYIYVASPYSHPDPVVVQRRYDMVCYYVAHAIPQGHTLFSPILHCHYLSRQYSHLGTDAKSWLGYNKIMQRYAASTLVLMIPGWQESIGVQGEIEYATHINQPIEYVDRHYFHMD